MNYIQEEASENVLSNSNVTPSLKEKGPFSNPLSKNSLLEASPKVI